MQEWMGRVRREVGRVGFHTLIVPSQELEQNVSLDTRFQCTAKTSLMCSFQD